jgi:fido (protein-threonine AMPylation protein)
MPHRAGYFVLAYSWDHHCRELIDSIETKFQHVGRELSELEREEPRDLVSLLNYYKKWHYNNDLYRSTADEIRGREFVINSLGYRGYGVNRDLLAALASTKERHARLERDLSKRFSGSVQLAQSLIYLPRELVAAKRSDYIIAELCKKLGWNPEENMPRATNCVPFDLDHYFHVMAKETPWQTNTIIFQKLFLSAGSSSMTIMRGNTGLQDRRSCQELKLKSNRNLVDLTRDIFSNLHAFTDIGIGLLQRIHIGLSRGLDPGAGCFRQIDFPDRNGVTFEFGNFQQEVSKLTNVLRETANSFDSIDLFIENLARSYYMFIGIHPFWDGNGRVGRCFLNHLFIKKGLPPVTFNDSEEIFVLPRYGGSMEDMHNYLKRRIRKATERYHYEKSKLESLQFSGKAIYDVSFDSGFRFSKISGDIEKIAVEFEALVIAQDNPLSHIMKDECRIVFPSSNSLDRMTVYAGFCSGPFSEWQHRLIIKKGFYSKEVGSEIPGARLFDILFIVEMPERAKDFKYFSCSVVSHENGLIFNNKGLNYSYKLRP